MTPFHPRQAARLLWELTCGSRFLVLVSVVSNVVAALFEGSTIGVLVAALQVLGGAAGSSRATLGILGDWLEQTRASIGADTLFLWLVLAAVLAQVLRSGLQFIGKVATVHLGAQVEVRAHDRLVRRIMGLSFPQASRYPLGELTDCLAQVTVLHEIMDQVNLLARSLLLVASYATVLLWLSWPVTLMALPAYWGVSRLLRRIIRIVGRSSEQWTAGTTALTARTTELLQALRLIHSFATQEQTVREVDALTRTRMGGGRRALIWGSAVEPVMDVLTVVGAGVLLIGGYFLLVQSGATTLPTLLAILLALHRMTPRLGAVHGSRAALAIYRPRLARIARLLAEEPAQARPAVGRLFPGLTRAITFDQVSLQYRMDEPAAVSELSCELARGSFTALVGLSGGGKSSVADLLLRLYEPTSGTIRADGVALAEFDLGSWRGRIGVVSQETFLFHATIRENIAYGRPGATMAQVAATARAAHAEEFIERLADGYETIVGDRGYRLSGGQRQRIALARALLREPQLLVLDEATSALDSESERSIQETLEEQRGSRTLLVIAHRLSTINRADRILILDQGRLVEQGTHEDLLMRDGLYARLWRLQSKGQGTMRPALLGGAAS